MRTDGRQVNAAQRAGSRPVCRMLPIELRLLLRRYGPSTALVDAVAREEARQAAEDAVEARNGRCALKALARRLRRG